MTKVLPCSCVHKYQDAHYGPQRRVHNATKKKGPDYYRCTVCGKERTA